LFLHLKPPPPPPPPRSQAKEWREFVYDVQTCNIIQCNMASTLWVFLLWSFDYKPQKTYIYLAASSSDLKSTKAKPLQIGSFVFLFPETAGIILIIPWTSLKAVFKSLWMFFFFGRLMTCTRMPVGITSGAALIQYSCAKSDSS